MFARYTFAMTFVFDHPVLVFFPIIGLALYAAGWFGVWLHERYSETVNPSLSSFKTVETSVLGLLALLLGFSFAMAVNRYDLRQNLEVNEANAIGTTWLRTATMDDATRDATRKLLKQYGAVRLEFFGAGTDYAAIDASMAQAGAIQDQLWSLAVENAKAHRDPIDALFLATLNDTIDLSEKRTAALENRIPIAAWVLLLFIAATSSALVGIGTATKSRGLLWLLPLIVGSTMMLILDLDNARTGLVRVPQHSMDRVVAQMNASK